jgi:hypothetical protein
MLYCPAAVSNSKPQDPDDLPHVHWAMKRFIAWQQQHIDLLQQQTASRTVTSSSSSQSKPSSRHGQISRTSSRGSSWQQQQHGQQQQQQFLQLLGPRLQLLSPEQATLLQQFCSSSSSSVSSSSLKEPGFSSAKLWGLPPGRGGLGLVNEWVSPWGGVLVAVLEAVVNIAKTAAAPVEAWEAAATLLR